jgi:hypothetical protein
MSRRQTTRTSGRREPDDLTGLSDLELLALGHETGFWDDHGRPAPWPHDIDEWRTATHEPVSFQPGEPPF